MPSKQTKSAPQIEAIRDTNPDDTPEVFHKPDDDFWETEIGKIWLSLIEDSPSEPPTLNRHSDPPENTSTDTSKSSKEEAASDDFCFADVTTDDFMEEKRVVRGSSPQEDFQEVDTILVETLLFLDVVDEVRKNLSYIHARLGNWLAEPEQSTADYIGIAKALLDEHKALVDSLTKREVLKEKTNQLLSGVVNPPKEVGDCKP